MVMSGTIESSSVSGSVRSCGVCTSDAGRKYFRNDQDLDELEAMARLPRFVAP